MSGNAGDNNGHKGPLDSAEDTCSPVEPAAAAPSPWHRPDDVLPAQSRAFKVNDLPRPRLRLRPMPLQPGLNAILPRKGQRGWLLAALFAAGLLATSTHLLTQGEQGVVTTLGRYSRTLDPGLSLTLPWPIERVTVFKAGAMQTLALPAQDGENLMPTRDGQLIDIAFQVRWQIVDVAAFAFRLNDPQAAIRDLADAQVRAAIAETPFDPVWDGKGRDEASARAGRRMQAVLDAWHAGVRIEGIEITRANPPAKLAETFLKVGTAESNARENREKAEKWAAHTINNAKAEAADFDRVYQQYLASPQITRRRMYYETMERVIANNDHVIVGGTQAPVAAMPALPTPAPPAQPQAKAQP